MKFLDLFCCCGGISKGFHNVFPDAYIVGVDIKDNHNYPYLFYKWDVFKLPMTFFRQFDLIHASPPCQTYSWATHKEHRKDFPDLIDKTRQLLLKTGKPFTIENVIGAPLRKDVVLCGEMFGLRVIRHRIFEIHGFKVEQPPHIKHKQPGYYAQVAGHGGDSYSYKLEDWKIAMGIDWVSNKKHLTQMIPPAYYEYIVKVK